MFLFLVSRMYLNHCQTDDFVLDSGVNLAMYNGDDLKFHSLYSTYVFGACCLFSSEVIHDVNSSGRVQTFLLASLCPERGPRPHLSQVLRQCFLNETVHKGTDTQSFLLCARCSSGTWDRAVRETQAVSLLRTLCP